MKVIIPRFRDPHASYLFVLDHTGNLIHVWYPEGDAGLRKGPTD